jgi:hypothetical protein
MRPLGLKPTLILEALRGAEAPLFHGTSPICEFFRSLLGQLAARLEAVPFPNPPWLS